MDKLFKNKFLISISLCTVDFGFTRLLIPLKHSRMHYYIKLVKCDFVKKKSRLVFCTYTTSFFMIFLISLVNMQIELLSTLDPPIKVF